MENDWLFKRAVESDTETPRECHLQACYSAYRNEEIPENVYEAVMGSAVIRKEELRNAMDVVNLGAVIGLAPEEIEENTLKLAIAIVSSYGIESYDAAARRLRNLNKYLNGLIFTEEYGPTE